MAAEEKVLNHKTVKRNNPITGRKTICSGNGWVMQAMKHMKRLNNYEAEKKVHVEPLDP